MRKLISILLFILPFFTCCKKQNSSDVSEAENIKAPQINEVMSENHKNYNR
jgi:hypothetical protein